MLKSLKHVHVVFGAHVAVVFRQMTFAKLHLLAHVTVLLYVALRVAHTHSFWAVASIDGQSL